MELLKTDAYQNRLFMQDKVHLILELSKDKSRRTIANINKGSSRLEIRKHISKLIAPDSYGFPYEVLKMASLLTHLLVIELAGERQFTKVVANYLIPISDVLDSGFFIDERRDGFDVNIFVPRSLLKKFPADLVKK